METKKFQENLIEDIKLVLAKNEVPLARIKELAHAALELDDKYPEGIPEADALQLFDEYGEITRTSKETYKREMASANEEQIGQIRRSLGLEDKK